MKKIVAIGRTYPYKGGISHFNTLLYKKLSQFYDINIFGWKRLYPNFLYPTDPIEKNTNRLPGIDSSNIIDYLNPITWVILLKKIKRINPDLLILNWFHPVMFPVYFFITLITKKIFKIKILFICHNVMPHEKNFPLAKTLTKISFSLIDYFIVHSKTDRMDLIKIKKNANIINGFLPIHKMFDKELDTNISSEFNKNTILFFGYVRKYKGLDLLLKAMPSILKQINIDLIVAGEFWQDKKEYINIIDILNINKNVKIIDEYIPLEQVNKYFSLSDLVVLPYRSATQSGIVQLSYNFNKPVIATDVGGLSESILNNKTGFLAKPNNPYDLAQKIIKFYQENKKKEFINNIKIYKNNFSWDKYINLINKNILNA